MLDIRRRSRFIANDVDGFMAIAPTINNVLNCRADCYRSFTARAI